MKTNIKKVATLGAAGVLVVGGLGLSISGYMHNQRVHANDLTTQEERLREDFYKVVVAKNAELASLRGTVDTLATQKAKACTVLATSYTYARAKQPAIPECK